MSSASYLRLKCTLNFNVSDLYAVLQVNEPTASLDKEKKKVALIFGQNSNFVLENLSLLFPRFPSSKRKALPSPV